MTKRLYNILHPRAYVRGIMYKIRDYNRIRVKYICIIDYATGGKTNDDEYDAVATMKLIDQHYDNTYGNMRNNRIKRDNDTYNRLRQLVKHLDNVR